MTTSQIEKKEPVTVRESSLPGIRERLDKLNRKAKKLGAEPVELKVIKSYKVPHPNSTPEAVNSGTANMIPVVDVMIEGSPVKYHGWNFLGTLDFVSLPGSVIIKEVPGKTIPTEYKNQKATGCDHCKKRIARKETFVVESESGEYKIVGRSCLKDFLGHDPETVVKFLDGLWGLIRILDEDRDGWGGIGSGEVLYPIDRVLTVTAGVIRTFGWLSKSRADEVFNYPTASRVMDILYPPRDAYSAQKVREMVNQIGTDDNDQDEARKAIEWVREQPANNSYFENLHTIVNAEYIPMNLFGFACSIVSTYQRAMNRLKEQQQEREKLLNEWVPGNIKDRVTLNLKLVSIKEFASDFGLCELIRFVDTDGRTVIWWTGTAPEIDPDKEYTVKATIKKLDSYNGQKQTTVTRVSILKSKEL